MVKEEVNKNRWVILFIVVMMTFMSCLDSSIVNVALPNMAKQLGVTMGIIQWVVTSYLIIISGSILFFGRLGDIIGKTRVFKMGLVIFTISSLLCGLSTNIVILVMARCIQAVGAAATMATNQGIITHVFPSNERGRALGITGTFVALGTLVGPALGGFIVAYFSWKYIFLINLPFGIVTFILASRLMPENGTKQDEDMDIKGTVLFFVAIVLFFLTFTKGGEIGYFNPLIIGSFIITLAAGTAFIMFQKKMKDPLLDLTIFHNPLFSISVFCSFTSFVAMGTNNIIQPFYLQDVQKLSPSQAGMYMMIFPLILSFVAPISGHLSDKIGSEVLTLGGLVLNAIGLAGLAFLTVGAPMLHFVICIAIMSLGNGLFQSPNTSLVMSTVPKHKLGIAGSINALVRNVGMVLGVSLSTTILYNRMSYKMGYRVDNYIPGRDDVFLYANKYVYIVAAIICMVGATMTAIRLSKKKGEV